MALLYRRGDVGAAAGRATLDMTAGNLDAHGRRLAEAGWLQVRKVLLRSGFEVRYRMTPAGRLAFEAYLAWLEAFLVDARDSGTMPPEASGDNR